MHVRPSAVISQTASHDPARRALERDLLNGLVHEQQLDVFTVGGLYDLPPDGAAWQALRHIEGDILAFAWLYPRAIHWTLHFHGITGRPGQALPAGEPEGSSGADPKEDASGSARPVLDSRSLPDRRIYCYDLRDHRTARLYLDQVQRLLSASPGPAAMPAGVADAQWRVDRLQQEAARRWYPVIDFSRCTNCLECIDFCLFGVYGLDASGTIVVEDPDACRKGCPACSRVCPAGAIMFPHHKTPAIAGGPEGPASRKIDLSELFGGPEAARAALEVARSEQGRQLREAARGSRTDASMRSPNGSSAEPNDDLDELLDELDRLDP